MGVWPVGARVSVKVVHLLFDGNNIWRGEDMHWLPLYVVARVWAVTTSMIVFSTYHLSQ